MNPDLLPFDPVAKAEALAALAATAAEAARLTELRDRQVLAALAAGATVTDTATVSGLSRPTVAKLRDKGPTR